MEQDRFELLESYLSDQLDPKKKSEVDELIAKDAQLATDLEVVRNATEFVKKHAILDALDEIHEQHLGKKNRKKIQLPIWAYGVAASVVFVVSYLFIVGTNSSSAQDLFAAYFEVYPDYLSERSGTNDGTMSMAFDAYSEGNFELAAQLFAQENPEEQMEDLKFYQALSLLSSEKPVDAIPLFQQLLVESSKYDQQIRWYLALAFIKEKEYQAARATLSAIGDDEYNHHQAQELLKKIEKVQRSNR